MPHGLDNDAEVFIYEQEFYPLSNFSSFQIDWSGRLFPTSEHVYQWEKFNEREDYESAVQLLIRHSHSAHDAFKIAQSHYDEARRNWERTRADVMLRILRAKTRQHEYVRKKLMETGTRKIIENSWRDNFWGWGPDRTGRNTLGELWMRIRSEQKFGLQR